MKFFCLSDCVPFTRQGNWALRHLLPVLGCPWWMLYVGIVSWGHRHDAIFVLVVSPARATLFSVRDPHEHTKFGSVCQIHRSQRELPLVERVLVLWPLVSSLFSTRHFQSNGQVLRVNSSWKTRQRDDALPMVVSTCNNPPQAKTAVCCVYAHRNAQLSFSVQAILQEALTEWRIWRGKPVEANRLCTLGRLSRWVSSCHITALQSQRNPVCGGIQRADALTLGRPRPNEGLRYLGNGNLRKGVERVKHTGASLTI